MTERPATPEQRSAILMQLGRIEALRRGVTVATLSRHQASELIRRLMVEEDPVDGRRLVVGARHGTTTGYYKDQCRCGVCREAAALYRSKRAGAGRHY